ncbi:MAG TPA: CBS domain-containing protein [Egibacteraceae bacterium]|nr:CBS domain-containing protein [Egibacteraceae bacterium]
MPRDLPVTTIMSSPAFTLTPETTVEEAIGALVERDIEGAPVVDTDGRLVGLLDNGDLIISEARLHAPTTIEILGAYIPLPGDLRRFNEEVRQALGRTVGDVMEHDPPSIGTHQTVEDAATLLLDRGVSRLAVVGDDGAVVGVITRGDLVKALRRREA